MQQHQPDLSDEFVNSIHLSVKTHQETLNINKNNIINELNDHKNNGLQGYLNKFIHEISKKKNNKASRMKKQYINEQRFKQNDNTQQSLITPILLENKFNTNIKQGDVKKDNKNTEPPRLIQFHQKKLKSITSFKKLAGAKDKPKKIKASSKQKQNDKLDQLPETISQESKESEDEEESSSQSSEVSSPDESQSGSEENSQEEGIDDNEQYYTDELHAKSRNQDNKFSSSDEDSEEATIQDQYEKQRYSMNNLNREQIQQIMTQNSIENYHQIKNQQTGRQGSLHIQSYDLMNPSQNLILDKNVVKGPLQQNPINLNRVNNRRPNRQFNHLHAAKGVRGAFMQKPAAAVPCGLGIERQSQSQFEIPLHMTGIIGYLGGQITDPFKFMSKVELRKRKTYRREYLCKVDAFQMNDLINQLKCKRIKKEYDGIGGMLIIKKKKKKKDDAAPQGSKQITEPVLGPNGSINVTRSNQKYYNQQRQSQPQIIQNSVELDYQGQLTEDNPKLMPSRYSNATNIKPSDLSNHYQNNVGQQISKQTLNSKLQYNQQQIYISEGILNQNSHQ